VCCKQTTTRTTPVFPKAARRVRLKFQKPANTIYLQAFYCPLTTKLKAKPKINTYSILLTPTPVTQTINKPDPFRALAGVRRPAKVEAPGDRGRIALACVGASLAGFVGCGCHSEGWGAEGRGRGRRQRATARVRARDRARAIEGAGSSPCDEPP
jgi:hypothetical protein